MNRAGSAPGFWSRVPHSARTSSTSSALTHSVSTLSRTSSDNPVHGCIPAIMPTAARSPNDSSHLTSNGIAWLLARCACRLGAAGPVRWPGVLLLAADVGHFRLPAHLVAAGLAGAPGPDAGDVLAQRLVAGPRAQQAAQVMPGTGEQAGVELAVG